MIVAAAGSPAIGQIVGADLGLRRLIAAGGFHGNLLSFGAEVEGYGEVRIVLLSIGSEEISLSHRRHVQGRDVAEGRSDHQMSGRNDCIAAWVRSRLGHEPVTAHVIGIEVDLARKIADGWTPSVLLRSGRDRSECERGDADRGVSHGSSDVSPENSERFSRMDQTASRGLST